MTEWTTIRVRQSVKDAAQERKPDDMTWGEFLACEEFDPEVNAATVDVDVAEIATRTADEIEARLR